MKQQIVSVSGVIGAGKDTVGDFLVKYHGYTRMSWAGAVKDSVAAIFGWDRELLDGLTEESRTFRSTADQWWTDRLAIGVPITPRWVMVNYATETMRHHFHPDIWVLSLERRIKNFGGAVVITDTRFFNELASVRRMGGLILGVHRKDPPWLKPFYKSMEHMLQLSGREAPQEWDLMDRKHQLTMLAYGADCMHAVPFDLQVHESEWQHVLWNDYDKVLPNTGTFPELYTPLVKFLESKGADRQKKP